MKILSSYRVSRNTTFRQFDKSYRDIEFEKVGISTKNIIFVEITNYSNMVTLHLACHLMATVQFDWKKLPRYRVCVSLYFDKNQNFVKLPSFTKHDISTIWQILPRYRVCVSRYLDKNQNFVKLPGFMKYDILTILQILPWCRVYLSRYLDKNQNFV